MKISDDYRAKVRFWAMHPTVVPLPPSPPLPRSKSQKFRSHAEFNQWKQAYLLEIARAAARPG